MNALIAFYKPSLFSIFLFLGLTLSSNISLAQTSELNILFQADIPAKEKQLQVDHFFEANAEMPLDSLADCYHNLGRKWYFTQYRRTGNAQLLDQAIVATSKAIALKKEIVPKSELSLQTSMFNLGFFLIEAIQPFEAIKTYKELVDLDLVNRKTFIAYRQLSETYATVGDFYKAKTAIEKGLAVNTGAIQDLEQLALSNYNLAVNYAALGYRENSERIQKYLLLADSLNQLSGSSARKKIRLANSIHHLEGNRLLKTDDFETAKILLENSIHGFSSEDSERLAIAYNSLGFTKLNLKDYPGAFDDLNKAIGYNPNYTAAYENLGDYYIQQNEFTQGLMQYQKAIVLCTEKKEKLNYEVLPNWESLKLAVNKKYLLNHLVQKARAWMAYHEYDRHKGHLAKALETLEVADKLIDEIRLLSLEEQSKLFWQEKGTELYMRAVEVCYILDKPEAAYYFMEKNKALLLLGDLTNEQAIENSDLPESIANNEFNFKRNIYLLENELYQSLGKNNAVINGVKDKIAIAKNQLTNFQDSIAAIYPAYARASNQIELKSWDTCKSEYVNEEQVVLQYIMNEEKGFALLHHPTQTLFFPIEDVEKLTADLISFYTQVSAPIYDTKALTSLQNLAHDLFNKLIPPAAYQLIKDKKVILVPDYILQQLPFEVLVSQMAPTTYLLEDVALQYVYSISYLDLNDKIKREATKGFVAFAPQNFSTPGLNSLDHSVEEIQAVNAICQGAIYLKEKATKSDFIKQQGQHKIIHLSTHADAGKTIRPWIAFRDDQLFIEEIYASRNQAEMVVLSGCNTSIGELKKGEGAMSLARAFFYAGTNAVIASLWSANDKANKSLMLDFYKELEMGKSKSSALRNAKLNYLQIHSGSEVAPFFWASTILIGNDNPITITSGKSWIPMWIGCALFLTLIAFGYFYLRK